MTEMANSTLKTASVLSGGRCARGGPSVRDTSADRRSAPAGTTPRGLASASADVAGRTRSSHRAVGLGLSLLLAFSLLFGLASQVAAQSAPTFPDLGGGTTSAGDPILTLYYQRNQAITPRTLPAIQNPSIEFFVSYFVRDSTALGQLGFTFVEAGGIAVLTGTPTTIGTHSFEYIAEDLRGSGSDTIALSIVVCESEGAPDGNTVCPRLRLDGVQDDLAFFRNVGIPLRTTLVEGTGGVPPLAYTLTGPGGATPNAAVPGLNFDPVTRTVSGELPMVGGTELTYTVTDSSSPPSTDTQTFSLTVSLPPVPNFPEQDENITLWYQRGQAITSRSLPAVEDPDGFNLIYFIDPFFDPATLQFGPTLASVGFEFNGDLNTLTGTPTRTGTYRFDYIAEDFDTAAFDVIDLLIIVCASGATPDGNTPCPPLNFATPLPMPLVYGLDTPITPLTLPTVTLNFEDHLGNLDDSLVNALSPLPAGLTFTPATRVLTGTPTEGGTTTMTYSITDPESSRGDTGIVTVTVVADPPTFDSRVQQNLLFNRNREVRETILASASGGTPPLTYALTGPGGATLDVAVPGMTFTPATRAIAGTPTVAGRTELTYTVTDSTPNTDTLIFPFTVLALSADLAQVETIEVSSGMSFTSDPLPELMNAAGHINYGVTDENGFELPPALGLVFDQDTRILSGRLEVGGVIRLQYHVTFSGGTLFPRNFNLQVNGPVLSEVDPQEYRVDTQITPFEFRHSGGTPPLTYALTGLNGATLDATVPGLTFDPATQTLTGTPTQTGSDTLVFTVTDSDMPPAISTRRFAVVVNSMPTMPVGDGPLLPAFLPPLNYDVGMEVSTTLPPANERSSDGITIGPVFYTLTGPNGQALSDAVPGLMIEPVDLLSVLGGRPADLVLFGTPTVAIRTMLTYTATDQNDLSNTVRIFTITVSDVGFVPPDQTHLVNVALPNLLLPGFDNDGSSYTLTGPNGTDLAEVPGLIFTPATRILTGTPTATGTTTLTYTITSAATPSTVLTQTFDFSVISDSLLLRSPGDQVAVGNSRIPNLTLSAVERPMTLGPAGPLPGFVYTLTGPNDQALGTAVPGLLFTPGRRILSGIPTALGTTTLTYTATGDDSPPTVLMQTFEFTVERLSMPSPVGDQLFPANRPISDLALPEAVPTTVPVVYTLTGPGGGGLPAGLIFTPATRILSGTTPATPGTTTLTYTATATDTPPAVATQTFDVTVRELVLGSPGNQTFLVNTPIPDLTLPQAAGPSRGALTYTLTGPNGMDLAAVPGLAFDPATRILSGTTPATPSATLLTYTVTDADTPPTVVMQTFEFTVDSLLLQSLVGSQLFPANRPIPELTLPGAANPTGAVTYALTGPAGATLAATVPGLAFDPDTRILSGTTPATRVNATLTYTATDSATAVATQTFDFFVEELGLRLPGDQTFQIDAPIPGLLLPPAFGDLGNLTYTLTGPNGTDLTQVPGLAFTPATRILSGTPTTMGDTILTYTVSDDVASPAITFSVTFTVTVNDLPRLATVVGFSHPVDTPLSDVEFPAVTGTGRPVIYNLEGDVPAGLAFDPSTRILSGTPTTTGMYTLTYVATTDDPAADSVTAVFQIAITGLALASPGDQEFVRGQTVSLTLPTVTGLGGAIDASNTVTFNTVAYTLTGALPDGLAFAEGSVILPDGTSVMAGILSGIPTMATAAAPLTYTATETNSQGTVGSVSVNFDLAIAGLALQSPGNQRWPVDDPVRLLLPEATGFLGTPTYTLTGPNGTDLTEVPGLTFTVDNRVSGPDTMGERTECCNLVLAGTPTLPTLLVGTVLTYTVTDTGSGDVSATFTVTIDNRENRLLTPPANQRYMTGVPIDPPVTLPAAVNPSGTPIYTLTGFGGEALSTAIPGLTFDAAARTLSGTPLVFGRTALIYTVTDDDNTASVNFVVDVLGATGPTLTAPPNQRYPINRAIISVTLPEATGFTGAPDYTLTGPSDGALPAGLTFTPASRILSGMPTALGVTTLTYTATNGATATTTFDVEVLASGTLILATPMDQRYAYDASVDLTLPAVTDSTGTVSYALTGFPIGQLTFDPDSRVLSGTFSALTDPDGNSREVNFQSPLTYTATDENSSVTVNFVITVVAGNAPVAMSPGEQRYDVGSEITPLTLDPGPSDPQNTDYSLTGPGGGALPAGLNFAEVTIFQGDQGMGIKMGILSGTPTMPGRTTLTYTVASPVITSTATFDVIISGAPQLALPFSEVTFFIDQSIEPDPIDTFRILAQVTGFTGALSYTLTGPNGGALPTGLTFTADATFTLPIGTQIMANILSGTPTMQGRTTLTYTVTDSASPPATATTTFDVNILATLLRLPVPTGLTYAVNQETSFVLPQAIDATGTPIYTLTGLDNASLPAGLAFDQDRRTLSGTPTREGVTTLIYTVTDSAATTSGTFDVTIIVAPSTLTSDQIYVVGQAIRYVLPRPFVSGTPSYTLTGPAGGALPAGLAFAANSLVLSGTPTVEGVTTTLTYTVTGSASNAIIQTFDVTVTSAPVVDRVAITSFSPYAIGRTIEVTVTFNEMVTVNTGTGVPQIILMVGENSRTAVYASGSGSDDLVFNYTVLADDMDGDMVNIDADVLDANGGTIRDADDNEAFLQHPAVATGGDVVDTVAPVFEGASVSANRMVLTYNERLSAGIRGGGVPDPALIPAPGDYVIGVTPAPDPLPTVSQVNINTVVDGAEVTLTLTAAIIGTPTVTLTYTPGTNPLRDAAGNPAAALNDAPVTVNTALTLPSIISDQFYSTMCLVRERQSDGTIIGCMTYQQIPPLNLPEATGVTGTPIYTLTGQGGAPLPAGLTFIAETVTLPPTDTLPERTRRVRMLSGRPSEAGTYTLAYTVTDDTATVSRTFDVTIAAPPLLLQLTAPSDQRYLINQAITPFTLQEAENVTGTPTYTLTSGFDTETGTGPERAALPAWLNFDTDTRELSGTPTMVGTYTLVYTVTDDTVTDAFTDDSGGVDSIFDVIVTTQLRLTPLPTNQRYAINQAITPLTLGQAIDVIGTATYTLTGPNSESLAATVPGLAFDPDTLILSGTPTTVADFVRLTYTVTDSDSTPTSDSGTFGVTIIPETVRLQMPLPSNQIYPVNLAITSFALPQAVSFRGGLTYTLTGPGGMSLGAVVPGLTFDTDTRILSGTPTTETDTTTLTYTVTDSASNRISPTFDVTVTASPLVDSVAITSDGPYTLDDVIEVTVNFNETVTVGGTPQITLMVGATPRTADYVSGSDSTDLVFTYTVGAGDTDEDGVSINANALAANGGTIRDAENNNALLMHPAVAVSIANVVDAVAPMFVSASVSTNTMVLIYDERLDRGIQGFGVMAPPAIPAPGDYTIGGVTTPPGTLPVSNVAINGAEVRLTLTPAITGTPTTVSYTPGTNPLQDLVGNEAAALVDAPVTVNIVLTLPSVGISDRSYPVASQITPITLPQADGFIGTPIYTLTGDLPAGLTYDESARVLSGAPTTEGVTTLTYTVTDMAATPTTVSRTFDVTIAEPPPLLQLPVTSGQRYVVDQAITSFTLPEAENVTGPPTYTLTSVFETETGPERAPLPNALSFDPATRILSGTPTDVGTYTLIYTVTDDTVTDDSGAVNSIFDVTVTTPPELLLQLPFVEVSYRINQAIPSLPLLSAMNAIGASTYTLTGPNGMDLSEVPGLTFDPDTRILSGTPTMAVDDVRLDYTVTDGDGNTDTTDFTVTVFTTNLGLPIPLSRSYTVNLAITPLNLREAIDAVAPATYTLTGPNGMPVEDAVPGLTFSLPNRVLSGTPTTVGRATLTYMVTDNSMPPATSSGTFDVTIAAPELLAPFLIAQRYPVSTALIPFTLPEATGVTGTPTYTLTGPGGISLGAAVPGLTFAPATRIVSGMPTRAGTTMLTLRVTDSAATDTVTFAVTITGGLAFPGGQTITQDYEVGQAITPLTLPKAVNGVGTITYTLDRLMSGLVLPLPTGLTFDPATRILSGTPVAVGPLAMRFTATDSASNTITSFVFVAVEAMSVPLVTDVAITSTGPYISGSTIRVTVTFDEAVTVVGIPQITLMVGANARMADYTSGTSSTELVFDYSVIDGDTDEDGVSIDANALDVNGGTIQDTGGNNAMLAHPAVDADPAQVVDTSRPGFVSASVTADNLVLTYNEMLDSASTPANGDYTITATPAATVTNVEINEANVMLTLSRPITDTETVMVSYTSGTLPLQDIAGNRVENLTNELVTISAPPSPGSAGVTISEMALTVDPEAGGTATYTVVLDTPPTADVTITPASDDTDAATVSAISLTFTTANWNAAQTVTVTGVNDDIVNPMPRTATVSHTAASSDSGYNGGSITINSVTVTVTDDDAAPTGITLSLNPSSVGEAAGDAAITVTATLAGGTTRTTETVVSLNTADGTALVGTDYAAATAATLTIPMNTDSAEMTLTIPILEDVINEGNETVLVGGTTTVGLAVTAATLTITDNDAAPTDITLSLNPSSVGEAAGDAAITVTATLAGGTTRTTETVVSLSTANGTALVGTDYAAATATLTIPMNTDSAEMTLTIPIMEDVINEGNETVLVEGTTTVGLTVTAATLTITDNDAAPTGITLSLNPSSVGEAAGDAAITVTATLAGGTTRTTETVVSLSTANGTALAGTDYAAATATLTIPMNTDSAEMTLTIPIMEDVINEGNETVLVEGTTTVGLTVTEATLTITDNDAAPTGITLSLNPSSVGEAVGDAAITVTATLAGGTTRTTETVVSLSTANGTALVDTDYSAATATLTIPMNTDSAEMTLTIPIMEDVINEGNETVLVEGTTTVGLTVTEATLTITDNDAAPTDITLSLNPSSVGEAAGDAAITVTATLAGGTTRTTETVVSLSTANGTALAGTDYAAATATLTIPMNTDSAEMTLTIPIMEDAINEGNETVLVEGTTTVGLTVTEATLTITDNDAAPTGITLSLNPSSVGEAAGDAAITVTATLAGGTTRTTETVVSLSTANGTALAGTDYAAATATLTIPMNTDSAEMTLTIPILEDAINEGNETVLVEGTTTVGLTVTEATLTITDNDAAPTGITLSLNPSSVGEAVGDAAITVTATLAGGTTRTTETVVSLSTANGTALAGTDYAAATATLTIPMNTDSAEMTLTIPILEDVINEGNETVLVEGTTTVGLTVTEATLTITDNDAAPTDITLSLNPSSVGEAVGDAAITVTATLAGGTTRTTETVVSLSTANGTALAGTDYAAATATLTIPMNTDSAEMTLTIPILEDAINEGNETVLVEGTTTVGLTVTEATLTITDNDAAPTGITLSLNPSSVGEAVGDAAITVTATLAGGTTRTTETVVSLSTANGTALVDTDYSAATATLTIPMNTDSAEMTLTIPIMEDVINEGNETVLVEGTTTVGLTVTEATLTITDNDAAPTGITLSLNPSSVGEAAGDAAITVTATLAGGTTRTTETVVSLSTANGTALVGTDYAAATATLTIPMNTDSAEMTLTIPIMEDVINEGNETVLVEGTTTVGLTVTAATLTITDNDAAPTGITLSLNPSSVGEAAGDAAITVTATLAGGTTRTTETVVSLSTANGTALVGTDYAAATATLTIPMNTDSAEMTLTIPILEDAINEGNETVLVEGTTTVGLTVTEATLTITDNDAAPTDITLSLNPSSVGEAAGDAAITVTATLAGGTTRTTETVVSLSTANGTALVGTDYAAATATLTIPMNTDSAEMTLTIPIMEDAINEGNETVLVEGTTTVGLTVTAATLTITDNDAAPTGITLSLNPSSVGEAAGGAAITVTATLAGGTTRTTETVVSLSTANGTALVGTDYAAATATLTIPMNTDSAEMTLTIPIMEDAINEGNETVLVEGTTTVGLTVTAATLTITDNDAAPTGITLSLNPSSVGEAAGGAAITVTATLAGGTTRTTETVVSLNTADGTALVGTDYAAATAATLTIPMNTDSAEMTLTIPILEDVINEGNETVLVGGTTTVGLAVTAATLTITDNDIAGVTVSQTARTVAENSGTDTYTVVLQTQPTGNVVISPESDDEMVAIVSSPLTFTMTNWNTPQSVTVTGVNDNIDNLNARTTTVTHTITGGGYNGVTVADVTVTATDDDVAGIIVMESNGETMVDENSGTDTYTVVLRSQPTASVVINIVVINIVSDAPTVATVALASLTVDRRHVASHVPTVATVAPASLTFTANNWNTPQTVIVTGVNDNTDNPGGVRSARLTHMVVTTDTSYADLGILNIPDMIITVMDDDDPVESLAAINTIILPEVARAMTDSTVSAIVERLKHANAARATGREEASTMTLDGKTVSFTALKKADNLAAALADTSTGVAALLSDIARTVTNESWRLDRALGNSSFVLPLTGHDQLSRLTLWGDGNYRNLSGDAATLNWDGNIISASVGADAKVRETLRVGLAASWQRGEFDYDNPAVSTSRGDYQVEQISVHPYLGWSAVDGWLDLWATVGYGFGDVTLNDESIDREQTSDITSRVAGVGGSGRLVQSGTSIMRIKGEFQYSQLDVEGNTDLFNELVLDARRMRLSVESTHDHQFDDGTHLVPTLEIGLRNDAGDGRTGTGAEVGGGLRFTDDTHGLTVESRGRILIGHSGDYKEWGVAGTIRFVPTRGDQGLAFSLAPSYGATASRVAQLWAQELAVSPSANTASPTPRGGQMDVNISYGLAWAGARAFITPYSRLSLTNTDTHAYRFGSRLRMRDGLAFNLEALRREASARPVEHGILLKLQLDW